MMSKLDPRYVLPSRKHFVEHEIPQLYSEVNETVVLPRFQVAKHFFATTDLWMSNSNHQL